MTTTRTFKTLALDTNAREVQPPADLVKALKTSPAALERWRQLSYSHQREHVDAIEEAKKPETRARRIGAALTMLAAMPARAAAKSKARPAATSKAKPAATSKAKPAATSKARPAATSKAKPAATSKARPVARRR